MKETITTQLLIMAPYKRYSDKLKDPRWQKKRLKILERDDWTCRLCGATDKTLHVHHLSYNGEPWEAQDAHLQTLCDTCHGKETDYRKQAEDRLLMAMRVGNYSALDVEFIAACIEEAKYLTPTNYTDAICYTIYNDDVAKRIHDEWLKNRKKDG